MNRKARQGKEAESMCVEVIPLSNDRTRAGSSGQVLEDEGSIEHLPRGVERQLEVTC